MRGQVLEKGGKMRVKMADVARDEFFQTGSLPLDV